MMVYPGYRGAGLGDEIGSGEDGAEREELERDGDPNGDDHGVGGVFSLKSSA